MADTSHLEDAARYAILTHRGGRRVMAKSSWTWRRIAVAVLCSPVLAVMAVFLAVVIFPIVYTITGKWPRFRDLG